MMDFGSFIAHAEAVFRKSLPGRDFLGFSKTHIFNLGEDEKIEEGIADVWDDLRDDMKDGVPMPFKDVSCVSLVPDRISPGGRPMYIFDRVIEWTMSATEMKELRDVNMPADASPGALEAAKRGPIQKLIIIRSEESSQQTLSWICYFYGVQEKGMMLTACPTQQTELEVGPILQDPKLSLWFMEESRAVLKQMAAISHPGNYVVQVTPKLTPKEGRRVAAGKTFPSQKRQHYVVVDHDVLVSMSGRGHNDGGHESHASPVPHHRRGHWMRLGERCKAARSAGRDRVWVRPSYVGDTQFADLKNDYKVLMDFGVKRELAFV